MLLVIALHVGLVAGGYVGVDIFFALSGFLITTLLYEEWERTGAISIRRFYERRARRLMPALVLLVAVFTLVIVVLNPFSGLWPLGRLIASTLLFANNWVTALGHGHGQPLGALVPTWTLAQEAQFYLLWPLALWILLRLRVGPVAVLGLLMLAILGLLAAFPYVRHVYPDYNGYTSPLDRGAELLLGCAVAILWRNRRLPALLRWRITGWLLVGGLLLVIAEARTPDRWAYLSAALLAVLLVVNLLASVERGAAGDHAGAHSRGPDRLLARAFSCRPLRQTGKLSYGLYLYHLPIYYLLWEYVPGRSPFFYAPIVFTASFLAAGASWHLIESPIHRRRTAAKGARASWALP